MTRAAAIGYMAGHEGKGHWIVGQSGGYLLQCRSEHYQANRSLGLPDDGRDFS